LRRESRRVIWCQPFARAKAAVTEIEAKLRGVFDRAKALACTNKGQVAINRNREQVVGASGG
jgi:hypothetical protein